MSTLEDALAIEALAKNCPVDLFDQVAEEESLVSGEVKSNLRGVVQGEDLPDPGRQPDVLEDGGVQGGGDLQVERLQPLVELDDHLDAVHVTVVDVGQLVDVFDEQTLEDGVEVPSDGEHFDSGRIVKENQVAEGAVRLDTLYTQRGRSGLTIGITIDAGQGAG